jgi:hypothetical protein
MTPPYYYIFVIIPPLKRTWPFFWTNLNSTHPRIICTKFDWIWLTGSGEADLKKKIRSIFTLSPLSLLGEGLSHSLNKLKSPSPKNDLWQVWLKLVQWFWRRSRKCKSLQMDRQTDRCRTTGNEKSSRAFSSGELKCNLNVILFVL